MSWSVKCPLHKHENLSLDSQDPPEMGKTGIPAPERQRQVAPGTHWPVTLAAVGLDSVRDRVLKTMMKGLEDGSAVKRIKRARVRVPVPT